jgi:hypothetical protein
LGEDRLYIKVAKLEEIYNFVIDVFIWIYVGSKNGLSSHISKFIILHFQTASDGDMPYNEVVVLDEI